MRRRATTQWTDAQGAASCVWPEAIDLIDFSVEQSTIERKLRPFLAREGRIIVHRYAKSMLANGRGLRRRMELLVRRCFESRERSRRRANERSVDRK